MLRRQRLAVDLVREERVAAQKLVERQAPLVRLLLAAVDAAIEPGEERFDRAVPDTRLLEHRRDRDASPARRSDGFEEPGLTEDVRLDVHTAVAGALHRHGDLDRRPRAEVVEREGDGSLDQTADLEPPRRSVDVRNVEVREEVVEPDRRDVPAKRLERHSVIACRELKLLEVDLGHVPRTLTALAVTRTMSTSETTSSTPTRSFALIVNGIVSVGLNAVALVSATKT